MATKIQHAYSVGDRVTLLSGRVVLINKLRKTPGPEVRFAPIRNQPWYEGTAANNEVFIFPQTAVTQKFEDGYPKDVPERTPRVLAAKAARKRQKSTDPLDESMKEGFILVWPISENDEACRLAGRELATKLIDEAPSGVSTEVLYSLLEFAVDERSADLGLLPPGVRLPLQRFLKKVRANQAALR